MAKIERKVKIGKNSRRESIKFYPIPSVKSSNRDKVPKPPVTINVPIKNLLFTFRGSPTRSKRVSII
jgi:hypothetical protein